MSGGRGRGIFCDITDNVRHAKIIRCMRAEGADKSQKQRTPRPMCAFP